MPVAHDIQLDAVLQPRLGAGEHQYAHTDYDMASVERTTDSARVYAFMMLDYLT